MSAQTFTKSLFNTSIPAILVYFSILLIGGCLARSENKSVTVTSPINIQIVNPNIVTTTGNGFPA